MEEKKKTTTAPYISKEGSYLGEFKTDHTEAFRIANDGLKAEKRGHFDDAIQFYTKAGKMLIAIAQQDPEDRLSSMINEKGQELQNRAKEINSWMDANCMRGKNAFEKLLNWGKKMPNKPIVHSDIIDFQPLPPPKVNPTLVSVVGNLATPSAPVKDSEEKEFTHLKYTPVMTKDPLDFTVEGNRLLCYERSRQVEVLIVITMYNEAPEELQMTLRKIGKNIEYITRNKFPGFNGADAWKKIAICIVSDGRNNANRDTLKFGTKIGIFDREVMTLKSLAIDVQVHLFEFSMQLLNAHNDEPTNMRFPPIQTIFALKEKNGGKLDSHSWFFNAFSEQLQPKYTVLLDVGTMPTESAIFRLLRSMERDPRIGGCCGEITVHDPNYLNFPVAAQQFEYKISNILDKSLESMFGYISVLPGAFSAYRYDAIRGDPLKAYFLSLSTSMNEMGAFKGNMYLAEDRILCFELISKKNCNWTLHYVKNAVARTDVPMTLVALIKQRRRWLNGSLFAALYSIFHFDDVWTRSGHSTLRKVAFTFQFLYIFLTTLVSSLLISIFYLTFYFAVVVAFKENHTKFFDAPKTVSFFLSLANIIYVLLLLAQFVMGMGNRPDAVVHVYKISSFFWALLMGLTYAITIAVFIGTDVFSGFYIYSLFSTFGIFFASSLLHGEVHHILATFIQYFSMLPSFVNILGIYSFCNLHDLSWGTKGLESSNGGHGNDTEEIEETGKVIDVIKKQELERKLKIEKEAKAREVIDHFARFRSYILLSWMSFNGFFLMLTIQFWEAASFLKFITILIMIFNTLRFLGSTLFILARTFRSPKLFGPKPVAQYMNHQQSSSDIGNNPEFAIMESPQNLEIRSEAPPQTEKTVL